MKGLYRFLILVLLPLALHAAAITSTTSGNWNSGATWVGGAIPGSGDTWTIATGHAVAIPAGYTATTSGGTCAGTGSLSVAGTLVYRGDVSCGNMTASAGSHFQHDSHLSPSSHYHFELPASCTNTTCTWDLGGNPNNHITWDIAGSSGAAGYIGTHAVNGADGGNIFATYVDFSDAGTASINSIQATQNASGSSAYIHNSTCERCGTVYFGQVADGANLSLRNFVLSSVDGASGTALFVRMDTTRTSGVREIVNSYIEGAQINITCTSQLDPGISFRGTTAYNTLGIITGYSTACVFNDDDWADNLLWLNATTASASGSSMPGGRLMRTYHLGSNTETCSGENMHLANVANISSTYDTWIIEPDCGSNTTFGGKGILSQGLPGASAYTTRVTNSIGLPGTAGLGGTAGSGSVGKPLPLLWNATGSCDGVTTFCGVATVDHNTVHASDVAALYYSEGSVTQSVLANGLRDNIVWNGSSGPSAKFDYIASFPSGAIHGVGYNWNHNDSGSGVSYRTAGGNVEYSSPSTPGTGDTSGDPQFVDATRNFIKWCQTINASDTTWAQCFAHFKNIDAARKGYSPSALIDWALAGNVPQNAATATASSTGGQVGAGRYNPAYPIMLYTDLDSGPKTGGVSNNGVFVTVTGKRFGATQGTITLGGQNVVVTSWADTKIVFQPGSSAPSGKSSIAVTRADGEAAACSQAGNCDFTVRSGNIYCISNAGSESNNGKFTSETGGTGCKKALGYQISISSTGTGYHVGDTVNFAFPSESWQEQISVTAVNGSGGITAFTEVVRTDSDVIIASRSAASTSGTGTGAAADSTGIIPSLLPGDTLYFGSGPTDTYQQESRDIVCNQRSRANLWIVPGFGCGASGTIGNPIAIVGYPGNTATIGGTDETKYAIEGFESAIGVNYWTIANLHMIGSSWTGAIGPSSASSNTCVLATQGKGFRGVNIDLQLPYAPFSFQCLLNPTATFATEYEGVVNRWYGNYLHNLGVGGTIGDTSNDNSKHSVMLYQGADGNEQEIAWNIIDATPASGIGGVNRIYHNHSSPGTVVGNPIFGVHLHDNVLKGSSGNTFDMTVDPGKGSGVEFYNNIIYHTGTCQNWVGMRYGYSFFGIEVSEGGYDYNWLPQSGLLKFYHNTFYDLNSNSCASDGLSSGLFTGPDGISTWGDGLTAPPANSTICSSSCGQSYSGTLPATSYTPYYFRKGVAFEVAYSLYDSDTQSVADDGNGNLVQEGQVIGAFNYATGVYSFTLLRAPRAGSTARYFSVWSYRVDLKNNVIYHKTGVPVYWAYGAGLQIFNLDHNLFYNEGGTGAGNQIAWPIQVTNPIGSNVNPSFVSASAGDFHLNASSPAIAAGAPTGVLRDFDGYPRLAADAGAFAYTGVVSGGAGSSSQMSGAVIISGAGTIR